MLIDSHCHLDRLKTDVYPGGLPDLVSAAFSSGVDGILCVSIDRDNIPDCIAIAERYPHVWASVGVHPLTDDDGGLTVDGLVQMASHPKVIAIGETGLDNYYSREHGAMQEARFRVHLEAARETGKPVIVHTREAREETLTVLREYTAQGVRGVLHCFTESLEMAQAAVDMGFYVSFSGIITFRNAAPLREVVASLPADRILVETDAPYLAPVPYRGKSNEPKWVTEVARCVAEVRGESYESIARQTTKNFETLFGVAATA